jgi:hypothetical protein
MCEMSTGSLQLVIRDLWSKVAKDKIVLQFLVDEYCLTGDLRHTRLDNEDSEEGELPRSFLLRCMRRFSELLEVDKEQTEVTRKRCYLVHSYDFGEREFRELHMKYDAEVGHGFFE